MPDPERRFVFASSRSNSRRNQNINRQQHTEVIHLPTMNELIPHGLITYGPHAQENRNGLSYNDESAQF
ncbi:hypothetical protein PHMEG_0003991 [Phytophthora megakarya]|uniref:Uncharacterized protein n=1 Tax=Phytophthora megakarya TaxID=4795 RepID=A0A225WUV1_9STRA|nr:hypothetical protein PHMEG_0003991 [Phytophthora megakarya]